MREKVDELFAEAALKDNPAAKSFLAKLMEASREGHLSIPQNEDLPEELFESLLRREGNEIYLKRNWECEKTFLEGLERHKKQKCEIRVDEISFDSRLQPEQIEAIKKALTQSLTLISGGPGTGKTFTASQIVAHFPGKVALCAPTGKATANLRKAAPSEHITIKTLHALLKPGFLPFDLVIVDEGSMIDAQLMAKLFSSLKEGSRLVICGDKDQLPPVESGNLFADLVESEKERVVLLTKSLRAELKEILECAEKVKNGEKIACTPFPKDLVAHLIEKYALNREKTLEERFKLFQKFRALSPIRKGPYGVETLNAKIHESVYCKHVPIMILENDEELKLYNGDCGFLVGETIFFEDGRSFPANLAPRYELAYLLSVHKAQGSEYEEVLVLLPEGAEAFGREMLYTAITRAKRKIEVLGSEAILEQVVAKKFTRRSRINLVFGDPDRT